MIYGEKLLTLRRGGWSKKKKERLSSTVGDPVVLKLLSFLYLRFGESKFTNVLEIRGPYSVFYP